MIGNTVAGHGEERARAGDLHNERILCSDEVVGVGAEADVVLCDAGHEDVSSVVNRNVGDLLGANATTADNPLQGAACAVELRDEHFRVGHVDAGSSEVGLAREIACDDDVADLVNSDGLWNA